jgi:hypothetical protein
VPRPALIVVAVTMVQVPAEPVGTSPSDTGALIVPLRYRTPAGVLSLFSTTTVFGTPRDVTIAELAIETFYPADAATGTVLRAPVPHRPAE